MNGPSCSPVLAALREVARTDPAIQAFLGSLWGRHGGEATEPTSEELAEVVRLQAQRWRDAVDVLTKLYERMPVPPMVMRGGG